MVGSLAYDTIKTPSGTVSRALGGSANYFSLASSLFASVRVVGVVGEDYADSDKNLLLSRGVDLSGLERTPGKTFHWEGYYEGDLNEAKTLKTELNVFENFNPKLPVEYRDSEFVFLANIAPELQVQVLSQVKNPFFVGMDTMNFWISSRKSELLKILPRVNAVIINETESKLLTGESNAIAAAPKIIDLGPEAVVIKRGEYGFVLFSKTDGFHILPAFPKPNVVDPTGAGDTFAGGFFGYLTSLGRKPGSQDLRMACRAGTILASFTIEDFGVRALDRVTSQSFLARNEDYQKVVNTSHESSLRVS